MMSKFHKYNHLDFNIREPVLDIGGGQGEMMNFFKVKDATIIDLSDRPKGSVHTFIKADITKKLPDISRTYKTIFIFETLEHLKNPLYILSQAYDLLDDYGNCFISMPYTKLNLDRKINREWDMGHVSRWTLMQLKNQVSKLGFDYEVLWKRRRFKNLGFWLPYCWITMRLTKRGDTRKFKPIIKGEEQ